jgi:hypothetical protein
MFLHSVLTYLWLVPEAFMMNRVVVEEKLIWRAMWFMAKDAAGQWAKCRSTDVPFLFPTWATFKKEFWLRFIEENEQDQALQKLESHGYFQGS